MYEQWRAGALSDDAYREFKAIDQPSPNGKSPRLPVSPDDSMYGLGLKGALKDRLSLLARLDPEEPLPQSGVRQQAEQPGAYDPDIPVRMNKPELIPPAGQDQSRPIERISSDGKNTAAADQTVTSGAQGRSALAEQPMVQRAAAGASSGQTLAEPQGVRRITRSEPLDGAAEPSKVSGPEPTIQRAKLALDPASASGEPAAAIEKIQRANTKPVSATEPDSVTITASDQAVATEPQASRKGARDKPEDAGTPRNEETKGSASTDSAEGGGQGGSGATPPGAAGAGGGRPNRIWKTLTEWLKDHPALLQEARDAFNSNPRWQGIDPDKTLVAYIPRNEVDRSRGRDRRAGLRGHHPHGLALGGPEGQEMTAIETDLDHKTHNETTQLQRKIIKHIRMQL